MNLEEELTNTLIAEIARELVAEKNPVIDQDIFNRVLTHITGPTGSQNAFDAPILYEMVKMMKGTT